MSRVMERQKPRPLRVLPVIDKVAVDVDLDPLFDLEGLSGYSGISKRVLRAHIHDPGHPLPAYQIAGGPFLVRRSAFDAWLEAYGVKPRVDIDGIVADVLARARP